MPHASPDCPVFIQPSFFPCTVLHPNPAQSAPVLVSWRILIVQDDPMTTACLQDDLGHCGYETEVVTDGDDAIERGCQGRWDLILLDVLLPGADGFEVCTTLRHAGVRTPIILLTTRGREAEKERGLDAGADDYVTKPFSPRELRARIRVQFRKAGEQPGQRYRFQQLEL